MKRSFIICAVLAFAIAPSSWTQNAKADPEDIAGTIVSDSPEALDFFLDWVSVLSRVQAAFEELDVDDPPPEMGQWAMKALSNLEVRGNMIEIPLEGFDQPVAHVFAQQVFHVFYEGPFREFCMDEIAERAEQLESDSQHMQLEWMTELGPGGPEEIMERLAQVREDNFELRLNAAELKARADALSQRIESQAPDRDAQRLDVMKRSELLEAERNTIKKELDRLVRQQEKLGTSDTRAIDEMMLRLEQMEKMRLDLINTPPSDGSEELTHLRAMIIEAEADYAGLQIRNQAMAERQAELEARAEAARDAIEHRMNIDQEIRQLERLRERLERRGLFGARGIPKLQFR